MQKFFISRSEITGDSVILTGDNLNHARVLRLREGEKLILCDGAGTDYACSLTAISKESAQLHILDRYPSPQEPSVRCVVYMGFPKADKLEHVIQKATELGAAEIVAFPAARSVARPDERKGDKKLERWQKIALSAAEQSGRGIVPAVRILPSWKAMLREAACLDKLLLFYENEEHRTLKHALENGPFRSVALITGPEGGLEPEEVAEAAAAGAEICTLGRRILRCETAPLCALSAVMYAAGEF